MAESTETRPRAKSAYPKSRSKSDVQEVVRARKFELVGRKGQLLAELGVDADVDRGAPKLTMYDDQGRVRFVVHVWREGTTLAFFHEKRAVVQLEVGNDEGPADYHAFLQLGESGHGDHSSLELIADTSEAEYRVFDEEGVRRARLGTQRNGEVGNGEVGLEMTGVGDHETHHFSIGAHRLNGHVQSSLRKKMEEQLSRSMSMERQVEGLAVRVNAWAAVVEQHPEAGEWLAEAEAAGLDAAGRKVAQ